MTDSDKTRLVAWSDELRAVHERLRRALRVAQSELADGRDADAASRDLLLYCHGFCVALDGHHRGEDRALFPAIEAEHPELRDTLRSLERDHSMIAHLLGGLRDAVERGAGTGEVGRHLLSVAPIMENHFRYEERTLLAVLETLALDAEPHDVLGPL